MANRRKDQASRSGPEHRVVVLVRDGVMPMELGLVHQVFAAATGPHGEPLYAVTTCTPRPGLVRTDADFSVEVGAGVAAMAGADTVVVPASHQYDETAPLDPLTAEALAAPDPATRVASVCTGAFVLAAAGLLDGRRATTHWKSAERFRRMFPRVSLEPDVLYTDGGRVLTSAGEASGIDLCLHMVRRDHGAAVANRAARSIVAPPYREGGQAQYVEQPMPPSGDSATAAARAWALGHLDQPVTLDDLARRSATSVRTLTRRFRQETGLSPLRWLTQQRLFRARQLLEETDLPVDAVAARAGFGTAASLRQHFQSALGTSPRAYRTTFRGTG